MIELITATDSDIGRLYEICSEAYTLNFADHWDDGGLSVYLQSQFNEARLRAEVSQTGTDYFFIKKYGEEVGFIKLKYEAQLDNVEAESICELEKIYVLPSYKAKGIGTVAMKKLMHLCKDLGNQCMYLCVLETNTSSIGFYKKLGFAFHSKTRLEEPLFKEELKGMDRMILML